MQRIVFIIKVGLVFAIILTASISIAVPQLVNYQGFLTDNLGNPIPDGPYDITFAAYDVDSGGVAVWIETHIAVQATGGQFSVMLGSVAPFPRGAKSGSAEGDIWLGITLGSNPEFIPRNQIVSVFNALSAGLADSSGFALRSGLADTTSFAWEANHAKLVDTASYAWVADHAKWGDSATYALTAREAVNAVYADSAFFFTGSLGPNTIGTDEIINGGILFEDIAVNGAFNGQVIKFNGTSWSPANDLGSTYTAGSGIQLLGTVISIAPAGVDSTHIANGAVNSSKVAMNAITAVQLANFSVDSLALQNGAVTSIAIRDNTIRGNDVLNESLTGADITDSSISGNDIHLAALAGIHLASSAITSREIAASAVGSSEIADGAITFQDMAQNGATQNGQMITWNGSQWQIGSIPGWYHTGNTVGLRYPNDSVVIGRTTPRVDLDVTGTVAIIGQLGIGTVNPQHELDVTGNAAVSGQVGIGMTNPLHTLDVTGDVNVVDAGLGTKAVQGQATSTASTTSWGGYFLAAPVQGIGVSGVATGTNGRGVSGFASATGGTNWGGYFTSAGQTGIGALGFAYGSAGKAVSGVASGDSAYGGHFSSLGIDGIGIYAEGGTNGYAADFVGWTRTQILEITGGADVAEPFMVSGDAPVEKGALMVIDNQHPGQVCLSTRAYDTRVAGVVSGAGGINSGLTLRHKGVLDGEHNIALSGRVYCLADASYGAIQPGDMLTTSDTPGHAMKAADRERAYGSVIGKAMSNLDSGTGLVLVLINLQ